MRRILVVDDNTLLTIMLKDVLEEQYLVRCATDLARAEALLTRRDVDVVLLDYHLADTTGEELAERAQHLGIPVIWMTGDADQVAPLLQQQSPVLLKPFSERTVLTAIAKALSNSP